MHYQPREGFLVKDFLAKKHMKLTDYLKETRTEMSHVTWPSRQQTLAYSALVIGISLVVAALLGAFDYIFSHLLTLLF
jgi:preprotein translocase subunit SecE